MPGGFCDIVLAQPKSPQYVAGRLWRQLASDTPPSSQALDRLVTAYGPGRNLRALTHAILTDDEFIGSRAAIVNTPVEWLVGVIRTLAVSVDSPSRMKMADNTLKALGQQPFYPPDVGGWPHGRVWMSTASADMRMRAASQLARAGESVQRRRGRCRRPNRCRRLSDRDRRMVGPDCRSPGAVGAQASSAGLRGRQYARISDDIASADA